MHTPFGLDRKSVDSLIFVETSNMAKGNHPQSASSSKRRGAGPSKRGRGSKRNHTNHRQDNRQYEDASARPESAIDEVQRIEDAEDDGVDVEQEESSRGTPPKGMNNFVL